MGRPCGGAFVFWPCPRHEAPQRRRSYIWVKPTHWPHWDEKCPHGDPIDQCPDKWEKAHGHSNDRPGALTPGTKDKCDRIGLDVRYLPFNEAKTYVTNLRLTIRTDKDDEVIHAKANGVDMVMTRRGIDIHQGCGDGHWFYLHTAFCPVKKVATLV